MYPLLRFATILLLALAPLGVNHALAKGGELKFYSDVMAIDQADASSGIVTITVNGFNIGLVVNGDTEIVADGIEVGLDALTVGSFVKIDAFFSGEGITAEEISVVESPGEHFALRGQVTDVMLDAELPPGLDFDNTPSYTTTTDASGVVKVTLLGTDVYLNGDSRITSRNKGMGNDVPADSLVAGDRIAVRGSYDGFFYGRFVHVGTWNQGDIELEGIIRELTDSGFTLDIRGGGIANIVVDAESDVNGEPAPGAYVEVEGSLTATLAVLANEVVVDEDGDGDGDDDHHRGYAGHGWPQVSGREHNRVEVNLVSGDKKSLRARVKTRLRNRHDREEQSVEVDLHNGEPHTTYTVVGWLGTDEVELGAFVTDRHGRGKLELDAEDHGNSLSAILAGQELQDITRIAVKTGGDVALSGDL